MRPVPCASQKRRKAARMSSPEPPAVPPSVAANRPPPTPLAWRLALLSAVIVIGAVVYVGRESLGRHVRAGLGIVAFITLVAACSANLRTVRFRTIAWGIVLQIIFALFILKTAV